MSEMLIEREGEMPIATRERVTGYVVMLLNFDRVVQTTFFCTERPARSFADEWNNQLGVDPPRYIIATVSEMHPEDVS